MKEWTWLIVPLLGLLFLMPSFVRYARRDPAGFRRSLALTVGFAVYGAVAVGTLIVLMPPEGKPGVDALAALVFPLAWIVYGTRWLLRLAPSYRARPLPAWLVRRFDLFDAVLLLAIVSSLLVLVA